MRGLFVQSGPYGYKAEDVTSRVNTFTKTTLQLRALPLLASCINLIRSFYISNQHGRFSV